MTKHATPTFIRFEKIVFLIPKNYFIGVTFFKLALVQPLNIIHYLSSLKISYLAQEKFVRHNKS